MSLPDPAAEKASCERLSREEPQACSRSPAKVFKPWAEKLKAPRIKHTFMKWHGVTFRRSVQQGLPQHQARPSIVKLLQKQQGEQPSEACWSIDVEAQDMPEPKSRVEDVASLADDATPARTI